MSKKDRMLAYITNNVEWFMKRVAFVQVIPYYELSNTVFNRAKQTFAKDVQYSDVVCLVSTSITEQGKAGILFTTTHVYSKAKGGFLTGWYKNSYHTSQCAEFDVINEFNTERMRELMSDLDEIAIQEDKKKKSDDTLKKLKIAGGGLLALMVGAEIASSISDEVVSEGNSEIANNIWEIQDDEE